MAPRRARPRLAAATLLTLGALVLAAACTASTTTTETGGAPRSGTSPASSTTAYPGTTTMGNTTGETAAPHTSPTTSGVPDSVPAAKGVLQGHLVQQVMCVTAPCPPQPVAGAVEILSNALSKAGVTTTRPTPVVVQTDGSGNFTVSLEPGSYTLRGQPRTDLRCPPIAVRVTEGAVTDVEVLCTFS